MPYRLLNNVLILTLSVGFVRAAAATPARSVIEHQLGDADDAREAGDNERAEALYVQAIKDAGDVAELRDLVAGTWLKLGAVRSPLAEETDSNGKQARILAAIEAYHLAIDLYAALSAAHHGEAAAEQPELRQELLARNNAAYLWQQTSQPERFVQEFFNQPLAGSVCDAGVPDLSRFYPIVSPGSLAEQSFYYANYGDLMLRRACASLAFDTYYRGVRLSPANSRAVKGAAAALARSIRADKVSLGLKLLNDLLLTSDLPVGYEVCVELLGGQSSRHREILGALLRVLAASTPSIEVFRSDVEPALSKLSKTGSDKYARSMASELIGVFDDPTDRLLLPFSEVRAEKELAHWANHPELRQPLALLVKNVATEYRHMGESEAASTGDVRRAKPFLNRALKRYAISWYLDPSDTDSALSMAGILHAAHDLDDRRKLSSELSKFYVARGSLEVLRTIATNEDPGRRYLELSAKDWNNISEMYRFLKDFGDPQKEARHFEQAERTHDEKLRAEAIMHSIGVSGPRQPDPEVKIERPVDGDRFASGAIPDNTLRIILRVYETAPHVRPDRYLQATLGFVDPTQSRFFGTFQQPLRSGQVVACERILLDDTTLPCAPADVHLLHPGLQGFLSQYQAYLTAGTGFWHSPSGWGAEAFYHLAWEFTGLSRPLTDSSAAETGSPLPRLSGRPKALIRSFYDFRRDSVPGTVSRSGGQDLVERRMFAWSGGYYVPIVWDQVFLNSARYRYQPFAAPLLKVGLESISDTSRGATLTWAVGYRYGIMRNPLTLRAVNPQVWSFVEFLYGTGLTFRQGLGNPGLQLPRQAQIRGEFGLPHTPIMTGFSKTLGPGPRNLQVYVGVKLDLLSLFNVFSPFSRGF